MIPELATSPAHRIIAIFLDEVDQTIKTSEVYLRLGSNEHVCTCSSASPTTGLCPHVEYTLNLVYEHDGGWKQECVATLALTEDADPYEAAQALVTAAEDPLEYRAQVLRFAKVIQL